MGMIYKRGEVFWIKYLSWWKTDPRKCWDDETETGGTVSEIANALI